jgi:sulfite reductase (NADPH) flavoprotein alpha-component
MPLDERLKLAEGRPLARRLFAAMAQQDCGQCGYVCERYAEEIASGREGRMNLCAPGGKDTSRAVKRLLEEEKAKIVPLPTPVAVRPGVSEPAMPQPQDVSGYSRDRPVEAVFRAALPLNETGSGKDTRHVVLDISRNRLDYAPGDSLGICPRNDPVLADAVLAAMRAPSDFPVAGKTFRNALIDDYALGPAPDMLFELIGHMVGGERRQKARLLAKGGDPDGDAATLDVLAALKKFGPIHPDPEAFLECLEPLQPRLYSIASSPAATPREIHLTVDVVRYEIARRRRLGVGSTFLADRARPGDPVKVYVQRAHEFGLPPDPGSPIIMVGPGTGIAPFRAFLWHRGVTGATGKAWLFFGHQREAADFFYRHELQAFLFRGTLTRLSTAWSRDGTAKVYVQDRMREAGAELWSWLRAGAYFYVCGDAKRMAKDVEATLTEIVADHGAMNHAAAAEFIAELKATARYQADVY